MGHKGKRAMYTLQYAKIGTCCAEGDIKIKPISLAMIHWSESISHAVNQQKILYFQVILKALLGLVIRIIYIPNQYWLSRHHEGIVSWFLVHIFCEKLQTSMMM